MVIRFSEGRFKVMIKKTCNKCRVEKDLDPNFRSYFSTRRNKIRYKSICKKCESKVRSERQYSKKYREKNKEKVKAYYKARKNKEKLKLRRETLHDNYVAECLGKHLNISQKEAQQHKELFEVFRIKIRLNRKIREINGTK